MSEPSIIAPETIASNLQTMLAARVTAIAGTHRRDLDAVREIARQRIAEGARAQMTTITTRMNGDRLRLFDEAYTRIVAIVAKREREIRQLETAAAENMRQSLPLIELQVYREEFLRVRHNEAEAALLLQAAPEHVLIGFLQNHLLGNTAHGTETNFLNAFDLSQILDRDLQPESYLVTSLVVDRFPQGCGLQEKLAQSLSANGKLEDSEFVARFSDKVIKFASLDPCTSPIVLRLIQSLPGFFASAAGQALQAQIFENTVIQANESETGFYDRRPLLRHLANDLHTSQQAMKDMLLRYVVTRFSGAKQNFALAQLLTKSGADPDAEPVKGFSAYNFIRFSRLVHWGQIGADFRKLFLVLKRARRDRLRTDWTANSGLPDISDGTRAIRFLARLGIPCPKPGSPLFLLVPAPAKRPALELAA